MKDPRDVVKAGDIVKVKVMEVDVSRKRIGLSMRLGDDIPVAGESSQRGGKDRSQRQPRGSKPAQQPAGNGAMAGAMAAAFANARKK